MISRWLVLGSLGFVALIARGDALSWPHENSDLPIDPAVIWGRLENGIRYAVCANAAPEDRASLRLLVLAGSLHETGQQRGYAHFVEHLAFDGTRLFPGQTLHALLQKEGLARGPDVNAHTHPDRTVYRLDLPRPTTERIRLGLQVLREFADGLTFDPAEVERERSVILIEKRARDSHTQRTQAALARFLFTPGPLATPSAFGTDDSIQNATVAGLQEFYRTWYRADNLVVVAVGTFDPALVAQEIQAMFQGMVPPAGPRPHLALGPIGNPPNLRVKVDSAAGAGTAATFNLVSVAPVPPADTRAAMTERLWRTIAFDALDHRLNALQRQNSTHFTHASASLRTGPIYQQVSLRIDAGPRRWEQVIETLEQELRRALQHGFTADEITRSRRRIAALIGHAVEAETTRLSEPYADALAEAIAENRVFLAGGDLQRLAATTLAAANPETCLAAFRTAWQPGHPQLFVVGNFAIAEPAGQFAVAYHHSARVVTTPPAAAPVVNFGYEDFGRPGTIVERDHVADLDIHRIRFANGVRLNLKSTPFEAGRIVYGGRFGTGAAGEPKRLPGLRLFVEPGLGMFGLRRHDQATLEQLSAGQLLSLSFSAGEEAFYIAGLSDAAGAERLMQRLTAHFTDPGWRKSELHAVRQRIVSQLDETTRNTSTFLTSARQALLAGGDPRYGQPASERVLHYSLTDLRRWIEPQLDRAPLEIGIVGNFDVEEMIQLAGRTLGCLPRRRPMPLPRRVEFLDVLPPQSLTARTTSGHAAVQLAWPLPPSDDPGTDHRLELLADVLRNRLMQEIRGELGAIYAANCQLWRSESQRETGYLIASLTCDPTDVARTRDTAHRIAATLAQDGIGEEEFERARQPRLADAPVQLRTNGYWLGTAVAAAQSQPDHLERPRRRARDLAQATTAEVNALAALVLPAARASIFTAVPEERR